jgi:hypothetical protein
MNPTLSTFTLASRKRKKITQGFIVVEQWKGPAAGFNAFVAGYTFGAAHGDYSTSFLNDIEELPLNGTGLSSGVTVVQLTYAPENYQTSGLVSGLSPGQTSLEIDSNLIENPIEAKPDTTAAVDLTAAQWAEQVTAYKALGVQGYLIPAPVMTFTTAEESSTATVTESEVVVQMGKIAKSTSLAACGLTAASDTKWLWVGRRISFSGGVKQVQIRAQYSGSGWDPIGNYLYDEE